MDDLPKHIAFTLFWSVLGEIAIIHKDYVNDLRVSGTRAVSSHNFEDRIGLIWAFLIPAMIIAGVFRLNPAGLIIEVPIGFLMTAILFPHLKGHKLYTAGLTAMGMACWVFVSVSRGL